MSLFGLYFDYFAAASSLRALKSPQMFPIHNGIFFGFDHYTKNRARFVYDRNMATISQVNFQFRSNCPKSQGKNFPHSSQKAANYPRKKVSEKTNHWKNVNMVLLPLLLCQEWKDTYTKITPLLIDSDRISELLSNTNGPCIFISLFCNVEPKYLLRHRHNRINGYNYVPCKRR